MLYLGLVLVFLTKLVTSSSCPCEVRAHVLSCDPNTIYSFPGDIADCPFENDEVKSIQLLGQPLTQLNDLAFADFSNLNGILISYCRELSSISTKVFAGVPELDSIYIEHTNISSIPNEALDDLTKLRYLDIRNNAIQEPYVSSAWHFCERLVAENNDLNIEGSLIVQKNLKRSATTGDYCSWLQEIGEFAPSVKDKCSIDLNGTMTCMDTNLEDLACELKQTNFTKIIFEFSSTPEEVQDFGPAETNEFIEQFNYNTGDEEYAKVMTTQRLFGTKMDLADIVKYTSTKTEKVIVHTDTLWMSAEITEPINFDLVIRSRRTSLPYPIPMVYSKEDLFMDSKDNLDKDLEPWAMREEHVQMSDSLLVRVRRLGRIEIIDAIPMNNRTLSNQNCIPFYTNATEYDRDISNWFNATGINLNYAAARTLQSTSHNDALLWDMTHFQINFHNDTKVVRDSRAFVAAQQFYTIQQMMKYPDAHNVPAYSLSIIKELAEVLHDSLDEYRKVELQTEGQITSAKARAKEMQLQFDIVEAQQEMYKSTELEILDAIFTSVNESWHWSFEHRNTIKNATDEALSLIMDQVFQMKSLEYKEMLSEAETAKNHYEDVVKKYEVQVDRYLTTAEDMQKLQKDTKHELDVAIEEMNTQVEIFEENVEEWKEEQEAKAHRGILHGIFEIGKGIVEGILCPECCVDAVTTAAEGALDIADAMEQLEYIAQTVDDILASLEVLDGIPIEEMARELTLNYKDALHNAIDLQESSSAFEDIQATSDISLQDLKVAIPEIQGTDLVQLATSKVTSTGLRLIDYVVQYAQVLMMLSERQDELEVAKQDLDRATNQVEDINKMLEELEHQHEEYEKDVEAARKAYEDEVAELEKAFDNATAEEKKEFEENINTLFNNFTNTLDSMEKRYNDAIGEVMTSLQAKLFGLRDASLTQRSMVMPLFYDSCDVLFYSSFYVCSSEELPMMTDELETILEALSNIEWDSLADLSRLPTNPTNFNWLSIVLVDDDEKVQYPVKTLKQTGSLSVNIKEHDPTNRLDDFWRTRLSNIRLTLLREDDTPIPSPGESQGEEIYVFVQYPTAFNNTNEDREKFKFLGQDMYCNADYVTDRETGEPIWKRTCEIDVEFADRNYKSAPDGFFEFRLDNMDKYDLQSLHKIKIEYSGSNIPYKFGDKLTSL